MPAQAPAVVFLQPSTPPEQARPTGTRVSVGLRAGGYLPVHGGYAGNFGGVFDGLLWLEAGPFSFEGRLGLRPSIGAPKDDSSLEVPIDVAMHYLADFDGLAPFIGGGVGMHYLTSKFWQTVDVGSVISTHHAKAVPESGFGPAVFGRFGFLSSRTARIRFMVCAEYTATFVSLHDKGQAHAVTLGVGPLF